MDTSLNVLVVDDELNIRKALAACLESAGHQVVSVGTIEDALRAAARRSFDLAFVDLVLGKQAGIDLIPQLLAESPWIKIVVITAYASVDTAVQSMKRGATDYLTKPFTPTQVEIITRKVAELRVLERRVADLEESREQIGVEPDFRTACPAMRRALEIAQQVARTDAPVLIRGESGAGKSVLARAIHSWSGRASKPFTIFSCRSVPPDQMEAELLGQARAASAGSARDNAGRLGITEGGTLLIQHIASLAPALQPKLLRFLETREYQRVGDRVARSADVRVIATADGDLESHAAEGRFLRPLLQRIDVLQIDLPPLRERAADVVDLASSMVVALAARDHRTARTLSAEARQALRDYNWPGNLRELQNVLERAVILCNGPELGVEHLQLQPHCPPVPTLGDPVPLDTIEELHIRAVLSTANSMEQAANVLGIDTVTLWRRRKRYGI